MLDRADDAALAASLVREAGQLAERMRREGVDSRQKSSASDLVTAADHAAEQLVVKRLAELRPADGILGEEGTDTVGSSGRTWVVDPIDGTYNFVHGLTWWCSALAIREGEQVGLGAVYHPAADQMWLGGPATPTCWNGSPVAAIADRPLDECSLTTYFHTDHYAVPEVIEPFGRVARRATVIRVGGAGSMDLAAVADGRLDLWCQADVPPWDWMPGHALVEGAGGVATQVEARGVTWSLAGPPTAVAEAVALLDAV